MERYFALKISFLNFSETKKFSTEIVLTFRSSRLYMKKIRVSVRIRQMNKIHLMDYRKLFARLSAF